MFFLSQIQLKKEFLFFILFAAANIIPLDLTSINGFQIMHTQE
jgi:hypothetical protein